MLSAFYLKIMEGKIQEKIERFIKLSKLFTKDINDIIDTSNLDDSDNTVYIQGSASVSGWASGTSITISTTEVEEKQLTRAEKILAKAEAEAKLSDKYDEYITLQKLLSKYFKISNKLT